MKILGRWFQDEVAERKLRPNVPSAGWEKEALYGVAAAAARAVTDKGPVTLSALRRELEYLHEILDGQRHVDTVGKAYERVVWERDETPGVDEWRTELAEGYYAIAWDVCVPGANLPGVDAEIWSPTGHLYDSDSFLSWKDVGRWVREMEGTWR